MRDYEIAEEEAYQEAKKTTNPEERAKLVSLIEGFRLSRKNTVCKLIQLIEKLEQKGLWLTYLKAEETDENLRTPRGKMPDSFLKRGARTHDRSTKYNFGSSLMVSDRQGQGEYLSPRVSSIVAASKGKNEMLSKSANRGQ